MMSYWRQHKEENKKAKQIKHAAVCGGANIFGSALLQPACSVCVSLSAFFITAVDAVSTWDNISADYTVNSATHNETKCSGDANTARWPKIFALPQILFPGARDGQNLISWRWSLPLPTDPVWLGSMHEISSYRGSRRYRPTNTHRNTRRPPRPWFSFNSRSTFIGHVLVNSTQVPSRPTVYLAFQFSREHFQVKIMKLFQAGATVLIAHKRWMLSSVVSWDASK